VLLLILKVQKTASAISTDVNGDAIAYLSPRSLLGRDKNKQVAKVIWQRPHQIRGKVGLPPKPMFRGFQRVSTPSRTSIRLAVFVQRCRVKPERHPGSSIAMHLMRPKNKNSLFFVSFFLLSVSPVYSQIK